MLVAPTTEVHQSFLAAMAEFQAEHRGSAADDTMIGQEIRANRDRWHDPDAFARYVRDLRAEALEETPRREGWVPCTTLWWIEGDQYLGRLAIRHRLTPHLLEHGGHIGYDVRPTARRHGHATRMLRTALHTAYGLGIDRALVTCDRDNLGSRKVIEANGGILEDERHGILRFWVPATPRERDWLLWHNAYEYPDSMPSQRLTIIQEHVRHALDTAPPGPIKVLSLCAGQGRDLTGPVADHPRRDDVQARLVELDPRNAAIARAAAPAFEVITGDAGLTDHYADFVPARLVLLCGMFGNMDEDNIRGTVAASASLCATGGTVIWTRGRREPDLVPQICRWYEQAGFEITFVSEPGRPYGVGVGRFTGTPSALGRGERLFAFAG